MVVRFLTPHDANQAQMAAYMRNQFPFLGVKTVERRRLSRAVIQKSKKMSTPALSAWLQMYYDQSEREYQYVAIDIALANVQRLTPDQYQWCQAQVLVKPWWDSVDAWRKVLATYIWQHHALAELGTACLRADDFWLRRVGITLQLTRKAATNQAYLAQALTTNLADEQFFIQKAIGWALRDYSKTDPAWVQTFIQQHQLSPLALREGRKYLQ